MPRFAHLVTAALIGGFALVASPKAASPVAPSPIGPSIAGGGIVSATDVFGTKFLPAGLFSVSAGVKRNGLAHGSMSLIGFGEFAAAWGACPYDPRCKDYPNAATNLFNLRGRVDSLISVGNQVVASGFLTEIDYDKHGHVVFREDDVQFSVIATEGSKSMVLQFCEVPPFTLHMGLGIVTVNASAPQPNVNFNRPAAHAKEIGALACQTPASASR